MADRMRIEFLDDGRVKVTTDEISGPNHMAAEQLLDFMAKLMGGPVERSKRTDTHGVHHHHHEGEHTHEH